MTNTVEWCEALMEINLLTLECKNFLVYFGSHSKIACWLNDPCDAENGYFLEVYKNGYRAVIGEAVLDEDDRILWEGTFGSTEMWIKLGELNLLKPDTEEETDTCSSG